ncbi:MAG: hypothetical protein IID51_10075 [Proteobacteria bacterium]|nr:hypothetical protein [Pseudomonadota bacterium]
MSSLTLQDEFIHQTGEEDTWREAFYFDFVDAESGLSGFGYAGVHPNQETGDVMFALWKNDILLARFLVCDFNIPRNIGEERMGFGPLHFSPKEPFKTWDIYFDDGHCRLDLTFETIHPAYFWADSEATLADTKSHHYEQQGRYTGRVRVGETTYEVNGVGVRDHAWGWGARAGIKCWLWASAQFSPDFAFNVFQVALADGREIQYGYIYRGDENFFLASARLEAEYSAKGKAPAAFRADLVSRSGEKLSATARIINAFNTSFQERNKQGYHFFCATEYDCEGLKGYGYSNFHWREDRFRPEIWTVDQEE